MLHDVISVVSMLAVLSGMLWVFQRDVKHLIGTKQTRYTGEADSLTRVFLGAHPPFLAIPSCNFLQSPL